MKVLLTGVTGYVGSAVANALLAASHQVIGLIRSDDAAQKLEAEGILAWKGDINHPESFIPAVREADAVIHAAWQGPESGQVEMALVETILNTLEGTGKPFIYTSSLMVTGSTGEKIADEESAYDPASFYTWRPIVEQQVLEGAKRGVRAIVIRPAWAYGRGGGPVTMLIESARQTGTVQFAGTGENRFNWVHIDDLADLYVHALEQAEAGTLLVGSTDQAPRVREVALVASRVGGAEGRIQAVPLEEARQRTEPFLGPYIDGFVLDQQVSGAKAMRLLGWKPHRASLFEELEQGSYVAVSFTNDVPMAELRAMPNA